MKLTGLLRILLLLGAAVFILGLFLAPGRIWPNFLIAALYLTYLGVAGVFFIAVQYATKAGWAVVLRRVPEAMTSSLVWAGLLMLLLGFGAPHLYEWTNVEVVARDAILQHKAAWLNLPFFLGRTILCFVLWLGLAWLLVRHSRRQDEDGKAEHTFANIRIALLFLVVFAVTISVSSWDWLMSLEPHWFSTIFGAYVFAGCFQGGLAAIIILVIGLRRAGAFRSDQFPELQAPGPQLVTEHHYHDLGKLLFAFSCFWAYLWFCQYMLIWYSNLPEETVYFIRRRTEGWDAFFFINLLLNWIVPFFVLMARSSKQNELRLLLAALTVALGRWFDLYTMVMPVFSPVPVLAIWEVAPMLGALALFALSTLRSFRRAAAVPLKDPLLPESVRHHS